MNSGSLLARFAKVVAAVPALLVVALLAPAGAIAAETVTVSAQEDAYVSNGFASTNYGAVRELGVEARTIEIAYINFVLSE